jgi:hypothetical protein
METRDYFDAMVAGAVGAILMTIIGVFFGTVGLAKGPEASWALLLGLGTGTIAWWLGFLVHVILGAVVAIGYLWVFELVYRFVDHWFVGMLVGIVHAAILGFFLVLSPRVRPVLFGVQEGAGFEPSMPAVVIWLALHIIFGLTVWTLLEDVEGHRRVHRYLPPDFERRGSLG